MTLQQTSAAKHTTLMSRTMGSCVIALFCSLLCAILLNQRLYRLNSPSSFDLILLGGSSHSSMQFASTVLAAIDGSCRGAHQFPQHCLRLAQMLVGVLASVRQLQLRTFYWDCIIAKAHAAH